MILHTLNASPSSAAYNDCKMLAQPGDALVLMGDGVYAALEGTKNRDDLLGMAVELYVLRADAAAAGVIVPDGAIRLIDMDDFVTLTERFPRQQSWY